MKWLIDIFKALLGFGEEKEVPPAEDKKVPSTEPAVPTPIEEDGDKTPAAPQVLNEYQEDLEAQPELKTPEEHGLTVAPKLKLGDSGTDIKVFQGWLERLGYELTRHGADGYLGEETLQEVCDFQDDDREKGGDLKSKEHALKIRGVGPETYEAIKVAAGKAPIFKPPKPVEEPVAAEEDVDGIVPSHLYVLCPPNGKGVKAKKPRKNGWKGIVGITLHQTATTLGNRTARYKKVSAHIGITPDGKIVQMNGLDQVVYHGNSFNGSRGPGDVGIEIDGHFAGLESYDEAKGIWTPNLKTYWRPKSKPDRKPVSVTAAQVKATLLAIEWIIKEVEKHGGKVKYIHAHRQSSKSRTSDPGEKVWRLVALEAKKRWNLEDGGGDFSVGGYPLPHDWAQDDAYTARYR